MILVEIPLLIQFCGPMVGSREIDLPFSHRKRRDIRDIILELSRRSECFPSSIDVVVLVLIQTLSSSADSTYRNNNSSLGVGRFVLFSLWSGSSSFSTVGRLSIV